MIKMVNKLERIVKNIEVLAVVKPDVLRNYQAELVGYAIATQDEALYGRLTNILGLSPESPAEQELYERYTELSRELTRDIKKVLGRKKSFEERRGTFIPSTVEGFRGEIPRLARKLERELPRGWRSYNKADLQRLYWGLRFSAEEKDLV